VEMPDKFFTRESVASLYGATLMVLVVSSYTALLFHVDPRWVALFIAQAVAFVGLASLPIPTGTKKWSLTSVFLAFANGALLYCSATGINTINQGIGNQSAEKKEPDKATLMPLLDPVAWWPPPPEVKRRERLAWEAGAQSETERYNKELTEIQKQASDFKLNTAKKYNMKLAVLTTASNDVQRKLNDVQMANESQLKAMDSLNSLVNKMDKDVAEMVKAAQNTKVKLDTGRVEKTLAQMRSDLDRLRSEHQAANSKIKNSLEGIAKNQQLLQSENESVFPR